MEIRQAELIFPRQPVAIQIRQNHER
jgi:hypothetical protein